MSEPIIQPEPPDSNIEEARAFWRETGHENWCAIPLNRLTKPPGRSSLWQEFWRTILPCHCLQRHPGHLVGGGPGNLHPAIIPATVQPDGSPGGLLPRTPPNQYSFFDRKPGCL